MVNSVTTRRSFIVGAAVLVLALAIAATPTGRNAAVSALVTFAEITEKSVRLPYWIVDHTRCFSLDRLEPTCPQHISPSHQRQEAL